MKIAVVHNLQSGGARRRLSNQLSHFKDECVEVCLESATSITDTAVIVPYRPTSPRLPRVLRPPTRYLDLVALRAAWRSLSSEVMEMKPDVVYLNPCRYLQTPPIDPTLLRRAVYFCDEPRRIDYEADAAAHRNQWTRPMYSLLYRAERGLDRRAVERAAVIATNSRYTAGEIKRAYGREATVVRLGVADSLDRAQGADKEPGTRPFVLSVGTLLPSKGHRLVVEAAAISVLHPDVTIVAPRADLHFEQQLKARARELGVELTLRTGISDGALSALYRSAVATLCLARNEPLGLVSLEAQACGCPVIVAGEGGLPETIVEGVTGWSCERDPAVAAALIDVLADDLVRARVSSSARLHAESWTWESSTEGVEALLSLVAAA
jgi:glycosyltransferase involved in cell wall biosynthesis